MSVFLVVFLFLSIYFSPAICAYARSHPKAETIFLLNLALGWTLVGWVVLLVWSWREGKL